MQEVKFLSKEQETESKHFKDPATNIDLEVTDKVWRRGGEVGWLTGGPRAGGRGGEAGDGWRRVLCSACRPQAPFCTASLTGLPAPLLPPAPPPPLLPQQPMLEWLANNYKKFGCLLEFVTDRSEEGNQFCKGFGGIGGVLRYSVGGQSVLLLGPRSGCEGI